MKPTSAHPNQWRFSAALAAGLIFVFLLVLISDEAANFFGVLPLKPRFADLVAILAAGEAHVAGLDVYSPNPLDPLQRPHVYGPWWLIVGKIGLVRADLWWLGPLLMAVFLWVAVAILKPKNWRTFLWAAAFLISPPVLLGMERANNDLIIFLIFSAAAYSLSRSSLIGAVSGGALLVTAAALKLYPVAALPAIFGRSDGKARVWVLVAITFTVALACYFISYADYQAAAAIAPEPITIFGTGIKLSWFVWKFSPLKQTWLLIGGGAVLVVGLYMLVKSWKHHFEMLDATGFISILYVACASCSVFCYLATISYPYRLVLMIPVVAIWFAMLDTKQVVWPTLPLVMCAVVFWGTCVKYNFMVERNALFDGPAWLWAFVGAEHASMLLLSICMLLSLLGWFWRWLVKPAKPASMTSVVGTAS